MHVYPLNAGAAFGGELRVPWSFSDATAAARALLGMLRGLAEAVEADPSCAGVAISPAAVEALGRLAAWRKEEGGDDTRWG